MEYRIFTCLLVVLFLFSYSTDAMPYRSEGQKVTNIDLYLDFDSKLSLPIEGDRVRFIFSMTPYSEGFTLSENLYVDYIIVKPNGDTDSLGYASFHSGPYVGGTKYTAEISKELSTPGIWQIYYVVTTGKDTNIIGEILFNSSSTDDYLSQVYYHFKDIHVLSFYEGSSIKISSNSLWVSIIGVIGTFLAFLLGLFGNFVIDKYNNSPRIKVICRHGFVAYPNRQPLHVLNIEAINYGRVAVTFSGVGFDLKKQRNKEKQIVTILDSNVVPFKFPVELLPGKSFTIIKNYKELRKSIKSKNPTKAFFRDQTGKVYYSKNVKKLFDLKSSDEEN